MKTLMVLLALFSFSASAFEIKIGNFNLPVELENEIRTRFTRECGSVTSSVKTLILEKMNVYRSRIDQGYVEDQYALSFIMITEWSDSKRPDKVLIEAVHPIQDRSGNYEPYITNFQTIYGSDGDAICNN